MSHGSLDVMVPPDMMINAAAAAACDEAGDEGRPVDLVERGRRHNQGDEAEDDDDDSFCRGAVRIEDDDDEEGGGGGEDYCDDDLLDAASYSCVAPADDQDEDEDEDEEQEEMEDERRRRRVGEKVDDDNGSNKELRGNANAIGDEEGAGGNVGGGGGDSPHSKRGEAKRQEGEEYAAENAGFLPEDCDDDDDEDDALSCQGLAGDDGQLYCDAEEDLAAPVAGGSGEERRAQALKIQQQQQQQQQGRVGRRDGGIRQEPPPAEGRGGQEPPAVWDVTDVVDEEGPEHNHPRSDEEGENRPVLREYPGGEKGRPPAARPSPPAAAANVAQRLPEQVSQQPRLADLDRQRRQQNRGVVREDGLDFNLDEPWQRSLLRELQKKNSQNAAVAQTMAAATQQRRQQQQQQLQHQQQNCSSRYGSNSRYSTSAAETPIVGVGHTESRDFAIEFADDMSLLTDTSSTMPIRSQVIHRPWIYPDDSSNALYADDDDDDDDDHHQGDEELQYSASEPKASHAPPPPPPDGPDSPRTPRGRGSREQRDVGCSVPTPPVTPPHREMDLARQAGKLGQEPNSPWLEMEPSDLDDEYSAHDADDAMTVNTATITGAATPADACFCMGYNVLDVMMGPTTSSSNTNSKYRHHQLHRSGGGRSSSRRHRNKHHTPLGRVDEVVSKEEYSTQPATKQAPAAHVASDPPPKIDRKLSRDPDGAYHDQYQYYLHDGR